MHKIENVSQNWKKLIKYFNEKKKIKKKKKKHHQQQQQQTCAQSAQF